MKKHITLFVLFFAYLSYAQSLTYQEAMDSNDPQLIAKFIKENPKHPKNGKLRYQLITLAREKKKSEKGARKSISVKDFRKGIAHQRENYNDSNSKFEFERLPSKTENQQNTYARRVGSRNTKTNSTEDKDKDVALLNHLFSNDKKKKNAYLQVKNLSKCPISLQIKGRKNYTLDIPAQKDGHLLVAKGTYTLSGKICHANYHQKKTLTKDVILKLKN